MDQIGEDKDCKKAVHVKNYSDRERESVVSAKGAISGMDIGSAPEHYSSKQINSL